MNDDSDSLYRDALHYDLLAQMTAPPDLEFYLALLGERPGRVLELGCGTGRLTLPLARIANCVVGIDRAPAMLERARGKALLAASAAGFELADVRSLALGRQFDWVLLPYNTLNHMTAADDPGMLLTSVRAHLAAAGRFVIDTFQPDPAALARAPAWTRLLSYIDPYSAERIELHERTQYDPARRRCRVRLRCDAPGRRGWREHTLEMRVFFADELDALLERHGFAIEARYGHYDRRPFDPASPKQLIVSRAR